MLHLPDANHGTNRLPADGAHLPVILHHRTTRNAGRHVTALIEHRVLWIVHADDAAVVVFGRAGGGRTSATRHSACWRQQHRLQSRTRRGASGVARVGGRRRRNGVDARAELRVASVAHAWLASWLLRLPRDAVTEVDAIASRRTRASIDATPNRAHQMPAVALFDARLAQLLVSLRREARVARVTIYRSRAVHLARISMFVIAAPNLASALHNAAI